MEIRVNMKEFNSRFTWNSDTVHYGNKISECKGKFFTLDSEIYIKILTDMNIFFTCRL